jgi:triosephosphate isomerase
MKKLIVANWKMNPQTLDEARKLVSSFEHQMRFVDQHTEVVVCAPFVFLAPFSHFTHKVVLGAQNVSWLDKGALTGEISAQQLKEWKVEYVILGHSERRLYLGETDSAVNAKVIMALKHKLTPILCLGGEEGVNVDVIRTVVAKQLANCTRGLEKKDLQKIVYVYEPAWAISTMKNAQPETGEQANEMIQHIYELLEHRVGKYPCDLWGLGK